MLLLLISMGGQLALAQSVPFREYQVKAVFLFNFAQFVEWPSTTFPDAQSPVVIGVLGKDPFEGSLEETVRGEKVNGRAFVVEHYTRVEDVKTCQILFISRSENAQLDRILAALRGRSVLTVSDVERFATQGGMIRFITERNKVRLRINLDSAKAAKLTLSSKLLRPADIVGTGKD
jgi:hypothetical protein